MLEESSNLSPICVQSSRPQSGCSSPWRVDNDAHLPSVFYFDRNSANLPTYSSDFIPSTPMKRKSSSSKHFTLPTSLMTPTADKNSAASNTATEMPETPCSSFSPNKSNSENIVPPSLTVVKDNNTEKNVAKHNLFREIIHQKPLKPINILEVISLPNWKSTNNIAEQKSVEKTKTSSPKEQDTNKKFDSELFGFEEFLDNNGIDEQKKAISIDETNINQVIRNKLHELKHLRPTNKEILHPATKNTTIDDDEHAKKRKQMGIKELFCSTMISGKASEDSNSKNRISKKLIGSKNDDIAQLFTDPQAEVTFDKKVHYFLRINFYAILIYSKVKNKNFGYML